MMMMIGASFEEAQFSLVYFGEKLKNFTLSHVPSRFRSSDSFVLTFKNLAALQKYAGLNLPSGLVAPHLKKNIQANSTD